VAAPIYPRTYAYEPQRRTPFRLSWGAVFAGLVVATALQIVLTLLGTAVGLAAWDPGESARGLGLGLGAGIWAILSILISLFVGGIATGRLAGILRRKDGALHGVLLWGLSTILTLWLLASGVSAVAGGAFRMVGDALGATPNAPAQTAGAVATGPSDSVESLKDRAEGVAQRGQALADSLADPIRVQPGGVARGAERAAATGAWLALLALGLSAAAAVAGATRTVRH
jgi:hypothetical protein